jgi:hypothetical protein
MCLQESIRRVLKEERKLSNSLIRRLNSLDYEVERGLNGPFSGANICIFFKSDVEFFESVMENAIDAMYYKHFSNIDDGSGEWGHEYLDMVDYIRKKHKNKIMKHYDDNCGSGSIRLKESIRRALREEKLYATPQELIKNLPKELKELLFKQWGAKQNPEWHPEGNTLKHIIVVIKRAYHHYPDDPNMVMAALFHDLGKIDTYKINPKTNQPTAYGHEDKSTDYVERFKDWIESFEGMDVEEIKYLVKNHMKVKPSTWDQMKDKKKEPITSHPAFDKLMGFTDKLDGGGTDLKESIRRILREDDEIKSNYQKVIDKFKKILPKKYSEKVDEVFEYIKDFINKKGFNIKVLNNCEVPFKGTRTKDFIIICSPELYNSLPTLIYIIFHEIRHEIQMSELKQINPLSGDLENFDELYDIYWKMEMDAHDYAIGWVDKIGNIINLPKEYYKLSPMVTTYPSMGHMVRDQIVVINKTIHELKKNGYDYNDISDLPFVKKHLDKLENLF